MDSELLQDLRVDRELRLRQRIDQITKERDRAIADLHRCRKLNEVRLRRTRRLELRLALWQRRAGADMTKRRIHNPDDARIH